MTVHLLASWWFWHPLSTGTGSTCSATNHTGCGYAFWSGIAGSFVSNFVTLVPMWLATVALYLRHHNCHQKGCLKRGPLVHAASGTRWCHDHAPEDLRAAHPNRHIHWPAHFKHPPTS